MGLFVSVALLRQIAPPRGFPDAVLFGVRTFLDLAKSARPRSPGQPEDNVIIPFYRLRVNCAERIAVAN